MTPQTADQRITEQRQIATSLRYLRPGENIYVNGMSPPFTVTDRERDDSGALSALEFAVLDKRYRITLDGAIDERLRLEDLEGNTDFLVLSVEHDGGSEYLLSDTRAVDYLQAIR
ncbi:MAG: hypothetical protein ACOCZC_01055 [Halodesulfurarchaeum sp.]